MKTYVVHRGSESQTIDADDVSSSMGGVLFFKVKTGRQVPSVFPGTDKEDELQTVLVVAAGYWDRVTLQG